jgi:VWFA-related protein
MFGTAILAGTAAEHPGVRRDQDRPTFRAGAEVVAIEASVTRRNRPVTGLTAADFQIVDNGVLQQVAGISYEKLPIDVTVALDVSASVTGAVLDQLRQSVQRLRGDLDPQDRLKLVMFNRRVSRLLNFTAPATATAAGLETLAGSGTSAVFDAVAVALTAPLTPARRHLIVLFTDGVDSSSVTTPEILLDVASRSTPTVSVVLASAAPQASASVLSRPPVAGAFTIAHFYDQLAKETGGVVVNVAAGGNLTADFRRVLESFRTSYVLYFTPQDVEPAGAHAVEVRVTRADVEVRARRGYVSR